MPDNRAQFRFNRPAPFAVYPEDTRRLGLERLLRLVLFLLLSTALIPFYAGSGAMLGIPVLYDRVFLDDRSPVVVVVDLPPGDYHVAPVSLGYFANKNEFVYTAQVSRGLIYGFNGNEVLVLEVVAPPSAKLFIENHLDDIRSKVEAVNTQKNLLLLERRNWQAASSSAEQVADAVWQDAMPAVTGAHPLSLAQSMAGDHRGETDEIGRRIRDNGRHLARLKELYYQAQSVRLDLVLSKFDLQLALARIPDPGITELLSVGDEQVVKQNVLGVISRLEETWRNRRSELKSIVAHDRSLLSRLGPGDGRMENADPFTPPSYPVYRSRVGGTGSGDAPGPEDQLGLAILSARLNACESELAALDLGLDKLLDAQVHVLAGGLPSWADLPRLHHTPTKLIPSPTEDLSHYSSTTTMDSPDKALNLLIDLDCAFEGGDRARDRDARELSPGFDPYPNELAYGLLVVDHWLYQDPPGGGQWPGELISNAISSPDTYQIAAYELGYLRFIKWYADLAEDGLRN